MQQPPSPVARASGLRIFLLVVLAIAALIFGVLVLAGLLAVANGSNSSSVYTFTALVAVLFAASVVALLGVSIRAPWSPVAAILAGGLVSWNGIGGLRGGPDISVPAPAPYPSPPRPAHTCLR